MKIVADENMPFVKELFSPYGEVLLLPGRDMNAQQVLNADALFVRSVTPVNAALLGESSIKFVGTATIGTDHVDQEYLQQKNIEFASAPGCNANAVVQYVLSALSILQEDWLHLKVGIIGCGNVGGLLYSQLKQLGVECRCFDPFKTSEQIEDVVSFHEVLKCDVVCLHTPLTREGSHPTFHLLNEDRLSQLKPGAILLNAGRGAVIDNQALLQLLSENNSWRVVLDVWELEPNISLELLKKVSLATPHIAGHSINGKIKGTLMLRDAFCNWLGERMEQFEMPESITQIEAGNLSRAILGSYDIRGDDRRMRQSLLAKSVDVAREFDKLRKNYPKRREFQNFSINSISDITLQTQLAVLGFAKA